MSLKLLKDYARVVYRRMEADLVAIRYCRIRNYAQNEAQFENVRARNKQHESILLWYLANRSEREE